MPLSKQTLISFRAQGPGNRKDDIERLPGPLDVFLFKSRLINVVKTDASDVVIGRLEHVMILEYHVQTLSTLVCTRDLS